MASEVIRRQCKPRSKQTRERIAAGMRNSQPVRWSQDDVARLRAAFARGRFAACREAFPHLRKGQVNAAVRRYCVARATVTGRSAPSRSTASVWSDPQFHRRFMEALTNRVCLIYLDQPRSGKEHQ